MGNTLYQTSVLAGNGKIYAAPYNANKVLMIDPEAGTTQLIGEVLDKDNHPGSLGSWLFTTSVVAGNGKIYAPPCTAHKALIIDPETDTAQLFGEQLPGQYLYQTSVLAGNGKI